MAMLFFTAACASTVGDDEAGDAGAPGDAGRTSSPAWLEAGRPADGGAMPPEPPAVPGLEVSLGAAGDYAVLAMMGISNVRPPSSPETSARARSAPTTSPGSR